MSEQKICNARCTNCSHLALFPRAYYHAPSGLTFCYNCAVPGCEIMNEKLWIRQLKITSDSTQCKCGYLVDLLRRVGFPMNMPETQDEVHFWNLKECVLTLVDVTKAVKEFIDYTQSLAPKLALVFNDDCLEERISEEVFVTSIKGAGKFKPGSLGKGLIKHATEMHLTGEAYFKLYDEEFRILKPLISVPEPEPDKDIVSDEFGGNIIVSNRLTQRQTLRINESSQVNRMTQSMSQAHLPQQQHMAQSSLLSGSARPINALRLAGSSIINAYTNLKNYEARR